MTTALLIRNPVARHRLDELTLTAVLDVARNAGWTIDDAATDREGHAIAIARDAAQRGVDVIVVHGGDGMLNEAANGIAGSETALAVLRGGTANIWAKETRTPKDPIAAMRAVTRGVTRRMDLGRVNGRCFLLMCGAGLDAAIVPRVGPRSKRWLGPLSYVVAGVTTAITTRPWPCDVRIDGGEPERSLYWMVAGNTRSYGGIAEITHTAVADDGELEVALMRRGGPLRLLADGFRLLRKRHPRSPNVRYARARSVDIATPGIPLQVDGEPAGATPARIEVAPLSLRVIVPAGAASPLFGRPPE